MTSNGRSEARNVILRLRRYRDRIQEIASAAASTPAAGNGGTLVVQRQIKSLKNNLDNDAHECAIGRKRMVQTACEHDFLWPALREAAAAIDVIAAPAVIDGGSNAALCAAQTSIQHYLTQLEGQWPTL